MKNTRLQLMLLIAIFSLPKYQLVAVEIPDNGPHVQYHDNGNKKSDVLYRSGKKSGMETEYWPDGSTKRTERHYKKGKQFGLEKSWYEDGQND